jgi:hypothetical protein
MGVHVPFWKFYFNEDTVYFSVSNEIVVLEYWSIGNRIEILFFATLQYSINPLLHVRDFHVYIATLKLP